ncbi:patatin-like phospholipase family protein [Anaerotignum lactatifermentans]|uniref:Patatin-like phospholipase family protein n=1 Tax=Anaerotignum lactatifermentans TaxID=160404 RepID=A0ABS2G6Z0_9FIRM|nr:patatin-like phospholipase family protein [Anaerotignum lactatifermentans]MBM6828205.1 patatin-like phospholipase family protein [Anaerotignum lactatifermentans]MBM6876632.1 patatin-like phospholipase family protein [Anaerotignum lactatifermentans]MBM6949788.1 patatin-like phospholipase family protein [Anaerotignum lactatifermentans]
MEPKLDLTKEYAVALEGGGAKGAYQIGVWRALKEASVKICAVSGTSVGALNGALMVMDDLALAEELWRNIRFSQIMDVDDEQMRAYYHKELHGEELREFLWNMAEVIRQGGFRTEPLRRLLEETVDEEKIRNSHKNFYLVTYSVSDREELDLDVKDIEEGRLAEMLLASAYFPAFKPERLDGKYYTDGGIQNLVPIDSLLKRGYRDLLVLRIFGVGIEKRVKIPEDACVTVIAPREKLGGVLQFDSEQVRRDMLLGYYDGLRTIYGLCGQTYYIDRQWSEARAYGMLKTILQKEAEKDGETLTLRELNEEHLPRLAKKMRVKGDYYELALALLERRAEELGISCFQVLTEEKLFSLILEKQKKTEKL